MINLCFFISKMPSFSLQFDQEQKYLETYLTEELINLF